MRRITRNPVLVIVVLLGAVGMLGLISGCEPDETPPPTGYALAIGLNMVDPAHYAGWDGQLFGCEPDANDMYEIASSQGLKAEILLTSQATREKVLEKLGSFAETLKPGDLLVVSYSGHGGQLPDHNGDETNDGLDETWCLYDGQLIDDELYGAWMKFKAGVRILVFSDSCHSGTVLKMRKADLENPPALRIRELDKKWKSLRVPARLDRAKILSLPEMREAVRKREYLRERIRTLPLSTPIPDEDVTPTPAGDEAEDVLLSRSISPASSVKTYEQNRRFYEDLGKAAPKEDQEKVKASVILISGCEDPQMSADIGFNGLFTWMLKKVWNSGVFIGDHQKFHEDIRERVKEENPEQVPYFFVINTNEVFVQQRPYTVE